MSILPNLFGKKVTNSFKIRHTYFGELNIFTNISKINIFYRDIILGTREYIAD